MPAIRRLAAILAADVAGYSRLMGQDKTGTAQALREHRAAADPLVANHGGRIVKTTGDEVLIEFGSVVAAVECALALQQLTAERNAEIASERRMEWRIGIHLGDVLVEGDDILGDGVNIAARLEGIAESGRICISEDAFRQVRGKIDAEFTDIGEQSLKNIAQPLRVYRAGRKGPTLTLPRERQGCPEKIRGPSLRKFVCEISRNRSLLTLAPPPAGGRGQGEGGRRTGSRHHPPHPPASRAPPSPP